MGASLGKSKVVLIDEVTSSVDPETGGVVRGVTREEFRGCTAVVVAHRLDSIGDADW